jgi:hypothetical protein
MLGVLAAVLLCPFIVPIPTHALLIDLSSPAGAAISNDMHRHWQLIQLAAIIDVLPFGMCDLGGVASYPR